MNRNIFIWFYLLFICSPLHADDVETLRAKWASADKEVLSAEIRYKYFSRRNALPKFSEIELRKRVETADFSSDEGLADFLRPYCDHLPDNVKCYMDSHLVFEGERTANTLAHSVFTDSRIRSGSTEIHKRDFNADGKSRGQVDIGIRDGFRTKPITIGDLRFVPRAHIIFSDAETIPRDANDPLCRLVASRTENGSTKKIELVADIASGLTREYRLTSSQAGADLARSCKLNLQGGAFSNGDIVLPKWRIDVSFRNDEAESMTVAVIDSATLNQPIDDDNFAVSARPDTVIVDSRENIGKPSITKTSEWVNDVVVFADQPRPLPAQPNQKTRTGRGSFLIFSLILGFVLLVIYFKLGKDRKDTT